MNKSLYSLHCISCQHSCSEKESTTVCPECGGQMDVQYNIDDLKSNLDIEAMRISRITREKYIPLMPIDPKNIISLKEGKTPLQHCKQLGQQCKLPKLYVKNEGANPTGVFKDRGSMVELSKAKELNAKAVCCASTGNMAASVSAYAAMANLPCYVVVPEGTPLGKLAQTISYGARIIQIRGTYADCVPLCVHMAKEHGFYLAGDYAFRLEGAKSCAYEIVEQLDWQAPDVVIVPIGCGTHLAGIWKGFQDYYALGLIDSLPRMIGVQPELVPTVVQAWREEKERFVKVEKPSSIASAVSIGVPQDDIKALNAIRDSNGYAETATDQEILEAEQQLATTESLFVEPSSAIPIATLTKMIDAKVISANDTVVCVATGTGLKDPATAISHLPDPPVLEPKDSEIQRYFDMKLYEITEAQGAKQIVFTAAPTISELEKIIKSEFNAQFDERMLNGILNNIESFLAKGREVNQSDLKNIIETFLNEFSAKEKILTIDNFEVHDTTKSAAHARVEFTFHDEKCTGESNGDGIFDAIIAAVKITIDQRDLKVRLEDYSVAIDSAGTGAAVKVTMTLMDQDSNKAICTATSPDVILASVQAFEKGYNILHWKNQANVTTI